MVYVIGLEALLLATAALLSISLARCTQPAPLPAAHPLPNHNKTV